MDPEREKDINLLAEGVLETSAVVNYNPNGADRSNCPFCWQGVDWEEYENSKIKHDPNCIYLIAKDLTAKK